MKLKSITGRKMGKHKHRETKKHATKKPAGHRYKRGIKKYLKMNKNRNTTFSHL